MIDGFLVAATAAKMAFVLIILFTFAPVLVWAERRQSAMMQDRIGPVRAGFRIFGKTITLFGLLHPLADALKMIWKEDFVPPNADKFLHAAAPIIALIPALATFAVIPFGDVLYVNQAAAFFPRSGVLDGDIGRAVALQVASLDVGILYIFAIAGTGIVGAAIAGYASDNKYSLLGGIRAAGQMVSYEVTLGLSLVGCFMVYDTLRLEEMVRWQGEHFWGIFAQPLSFLLFFTASVAESKRIPFDVPEGESEIVGGYFTEYSGMKFGMFFMGEFMEVVVGSALIVTLFFGGYELPFLERSGFVFEWMGQAVELPLRHGVVVALQVVTFLVKLVLMMWFQLMIRWTLPRFRYDQIMKLCWRVLLPLSLLNILVTGVWLLL